MEALSELESGRLIDGKYYVDSLLGRGGMGQVYRARHRLTDRTVALKWVDSRDPEKQARLLREARSTSKIAHPNVVEILDAGECEGAVYMAMSYIEGCDLKAFARQRPFSPAQALQLLEPAMDGVEAAHEAGLIHRDIKPANLLVTFDEDGEPNDTKVLDFGIAKALQDEGDTRLTKAGTMVGTPKYMAPEQILGEPAVDFSTDVYALTLVLYELLTGRAPFSESSAEGLGREIVMGRLLPLRDLAPHLPEELGEVIARGAAPGQARRFRTVGALRCALEPFRNCPLTFLDSLPEMAAQPALPGTVTVPDSHRREAPKMATRAMEITENRLSLSSTRNSAGEAKQSVPPWWLLGASATGLAILLIYLLPMSSQATADPQEKAGGVVAPIETKAPPASGQREDSSEVAESPTAQPGSPQTSAAQNDTAQNDTAQNDTAQNDTAQSDTAQNDTAQSSTAQNGKTIGSDAHDLPQKDPAPQVSAQTRADNSPTAPPPTLPSNQEPSARTASPRVVESRAGLLRVEDF